MMDSAIVLSDVSKTFGDEYVLRNISVCFETGKIHGIIGRNGSGKSMLFKVICGIVSVTSGTVTVNGQHIGSDVDFPNDVGLLINEPGFLPYLNAYQNLKIFADIRGKIGPKQIQDAIQMVGLGHTGKKRVGKFSMGMRQRLGIAQAIMEDPKLLILDEPMSGLDTQGVNDIRNLLKALKDQGKTILLSSHYMEDIEFLCDTVHHMDKGYISRRE